jgi:hypothetical protein
MRLKFVAASATGRTRCGEFVDQKDERKPIVLVINDQKLPVEKWESEGSYLFLLTSSSLARRLVTPKLKRRRKPRAKVADLPRRRISRYAQ